jgi:hypothetical protein
MDLDLHRPVVDEATGTVTLYLWNLSGQLVGYQQYNPYGDKKLCGSKVNAKANGKYFTYRKQPTVAVWGLESLYQSSGVVYITEGVWDACRLTELGETALATLGNDPPRDYGNWLEMLGRPVVAVCDNDAAGRKLRKYGNYVETVEGGKDLGESPDEYVRHLVSKYRDLA